MWVSQSPWWCSLRVLLALSTTVCRFFGHPNPVDFDHRPIWHEKASGEIWRQQNFLPSPPFRFVFPWKWSASRRRHLGSLAFAGIFLAAGLCLTCLTLAYTTIADTSYTGWDKIWCNEPQNLGHNWVKTLSNFSIIRFCKQTLKSRENFKNRCQIRKKQVFDGKLWLNTFEKIRFLMILEVICWFSICYHCCCWLDLNLNNKDGIGGSTFKDWDVFNSLKSL